MSPIVIALLILTILALAIAYWSFDQMGRKSRMIEGFVSHPNNDMAHVWDYPGAKAYGIKAGRRIVVVRADAPFVCQFGFDLIMPFWYFPLMSLLKWVPRSKLHGTRESPFFDPTGNAASVPDGDTGDHIAVYSMRVGKNPYTYRILIASRQVTHVTVSSTQEDQVHIPTTRNPSHIYSKWWYN